ncbi:hypothetical protein KY362_04220 [Candidatus Woesearchaeota archaeon]|nr:hypothetical protein [Candidatus Woesearchaeota archaeon]
MTPEAIEPMTGTPEAKSAGYASPRTPVAKAGKPGQQAHKKAEPDPLPQIHRLRTGVITFLVRTHREIVKAEQDLTAKSREYEELRKGRDIAFLRDPNTEVHKKLDELGVLQAGLFNRYLAFLGLLGVWNRIEKRTFRHVRKLAAEASVIRHGSAITGSPLMNLSHPELSRLEDTLRKLELDIRRSFGEIMRLRNPAEGSVRKLGLSLTSITGILSKSKTGDEFTRALKDNYGGRANIAEKDIWWGMSGAKHHPPRVWEKATKNRKLVRQVLEPPRPAAVDPGFASWSAEVHAARKRAGSPETFAQDAENIDASVADIVAGMKRDADLIGDVISKLEVRPKGDRKEGFADAEDAKLDTLMDIIGKYLPKKDIFGFPGGNIVRMAAKSTLKILEYSPIIIIATILAVFAAGAPGSTPWGKTYQGINSMFDMFGWFQESEEDINAAIEHVERAYDFVQVSGRAVDSAIEYTDGVRERIGVSPINTLRQMERCANDAMNLEVSILEPRASIDRVSRVIDICNSIPADSLNTVVRSVEVMYAVYQDVSDPQWSVRQQVEQARSAYEKLPTREELSADLELLREAAASTGNYVMIVASNPFLALTSFVFAFFSVIVGYVLIKEAGRQGYMRAKQRSEDKKEEQKEKDRIAAEGGGREADAELASLEQRFEDRPDSEQSGMSLPAGDLQQESRPPQP